MNFWAIIPVKPLRRGKSRLSGVLSEEERYQLNRYLLANTLNTLRSVSEITQVLVISRDPEALALSRSHGARTVLENGSSHLNLALVRATLVARNYTPRGVLVVPADLPLIETADVHALLSRASNPPVVVIAPDRHHTGTNALAISPTGLIEYSFGPRSFLRHCELARKAGARLEICELPGLALDVDLPQDLELASAGLNGMVFESKVYY